VDAVTAVVVTVNVAVELPAATTTLAGTTADVLLLDSAMVAPPAGAAMVKVTVPVEGLPPATLAGLNVTVDRAAAGVIVSAAVFVTPA
jgi:hypothetical protein